MFRYNPERDLLPGRVPGVQRHHARPRLHPQRHRTGMRNLLLKCFIYDDSSFVSLYMFEGPYELFVSCFNPHSSCSLLSMKKD